VNNTSKRRRVVTVIHVNQHVIRANVKSGRRDPCIAVRGGRSGKATLAHEVRIKDAAGNVVCRVVCSLGKPLPCGAGVWLETPLAVEIEAPGSSG
jgi:hypothetical protein